MKRLSHFLSILSILGVVIAALIPGTSAFATARGVVLDRGSFSAAIPKGFTGSSDLDDCEFRRYAKDGYHYQQIFTGETDRCEEPTVGSPSKGDVSIYKRFSVNPGEYYKAWALTRTINPQDAVAQVKLILRDLEQEPRPGVGECYGFTDSTSFTAIHTGLRAIGMNEHKENPPERSPSGGCLIPDGVDQVVLHFRVRAREVHAYGKAVLDHLRFGRCADDGDCSNIPQP